MKDTDSNRILSADAVAGIPAGCHRISRLPRLRDALGVDCQDIAEVDDGTAYPRNGEVVKRCVGGCPFT